MIEGLIVGLGAFVVMVGILAGLAWVLMAAEKPEPTDKEVLKALEKWRAGK